MSFDSPPNTGSPGASPAVSTTSPAGSVNGGAWGGSEYVGGGVFTDMYDAGKNLKDGWVNHGTISAVCLGRGLLTTITLLFIILLLAYSTGTLSLTSSNAMGIGVMAIIGLMLSMILDLILAINPKFFEADPVPPAAQSQNAAQPQPAAQSQPAAPANQP